MSIKRGSLINELEELLFEILSYRKDEREEYEDFDFSAQEMEHDNEEQEQEDEELDFENEQAFLRGLFGDINQRLFPFVVEVLNENEYEGSPLFEGTISREFLAQLIDQVIERAAASLNDVEEIAIGVQSTGALWERNALLRSTVESSILREIFAIRRPRYRRDRIFFRRPRRFPPRRRPGSPVRPQPPRPLPIRPQPPRPMPPPIRPQPPRPEPIRPQPPRPEPIRPQPPRPEPIRPPGQLRPRPPRLR